MIYRASPSPAGTCPRCREALLGIAGFPGARWCDRCGGVLCDVEASNRVVTALDRTLLEIGFQASLGKRAKPDDPRAITCPECLVEMLKTRIPSANCEIDACPAHGTWFDTGELVDVLRALQGARRRGLAMGRASAPGEAAVSIEDAPPLDQEPAPPGPLGGLLRWLIG